MNAKNKILIWATILLALTTGIIVYANSITKDIKPTIREQCELGSIDACKIISLQAKKQKEEAISQWIKADEKLNELLSWTNFIHKSEIEKLN